ncbi:hypothetical protein GCM10027614_67990 [Micromonospora vulcania]
MEFTKGHGTGNDFVLLPDPDGQLDLTPELVAALCDRRRGIGADGVLRVVRAAKHPDGAGLAGEAEWFMDYWNADGSFAEMCGNGAGSSSATWSTPGWPRRSARRCRWPPGPGWCARWSTATRCPSRCAAPSCTTAPPPSSAG